MNFGSLSLLQGKLSKMGITCIFGYVKIFYVKIFHVKIFHVKILYVSVIRGDTLELKSEGMVGYIITLKIQCIKEQSKNPGGREWTCACVALNSQEIIILSYYC